MSLLDEVDAVLRQGASGATMHRLGRGEGHPGASEPEMIELLMAMSNAMSTTIRLIAAQVDELSAASRVEPA